MISELNQWHIVDSNGLHWIATAQNISTDGVTVTFSSPGSGVIAIFRHPESVIKLSTLELVPELV